MGERTSRSLRFADCARVVADEARRGGLAVVPSFRSPPRVLGRDRSMRRRGDGTVVIAVNLAGRPFAAVLADMIEGTVAANRLAADQADRWRRRLWVALAEHVPSSVSDAA